MRAALVNWLSMPPCNNPPFSLDLQPRRVVQKWLAPREVKHSNPRLFEHITRDNYPHVSLSNDLLRNKKYGILQKKIFLRVVMSLFEILMYSFTKKWIFAMHNLVYENNCTEKKYIAWRKRTFGGSLMRFLLANFSLFIKIRKHEIIN